MRNPSVLLVAIAVLSLDPSRGRAQDLRPKGHPRQGVRSSPFSPPEATDSVFIVDASSGLDTGCTYRGGGPLEFDVVINRFVGPVNPDGTLVQAVIASGAVARTATLSMPAFDVDFDATPQDASPERDTVSLNGELLGNPLLTGANDIWKLNSFSIPISALRFPADPGPGGVLQPVTNHIRIDIDVANAPSGSEVWCTAIDWAAITIKAVRPVVFAHGILSDGKIWGEPSPPSPWTSYLDGRRIPHEGGPPKPLNLGWLDSIGNNAVKIGARVSAVQQRWGVKKVNIVSHSKGGLDARHYAEGHSSVDQLIQLGTPNAGSPLADYVQGVLVGTLGFIPALAFNALAGPAGIQLTTGFMATYNASHGRNANTTYTAFAGDYSDAPLLSLRRILGALIPGPDDTIVPVASVHALPYMRHPTHPSHGGDVSATHSGVHHSTSIQGRLGTTVGTMRSAPVLNLPGLVPHAASVVGALTQGQIATSSVVVDGGSRVVVSLYYSMGDLNLAVIRPGGQRIDASNANSLPGVRRVADESTNGFKMEAIEIDSPQAGVFGVEIAAALVDNPEGEEPFVVTAWFPESALTLAVDLADASLVAGQDLEISASVMDDKAGVAGAGVVAELLKPDGATIVTLNLSDSGGGLYAGVLQAPLDAGVYRGKVVATGTKAGGNAFSREESVIFTVASSASTLQPPHADMGVDLDGNQLFNQLAVTVGLSITNAAHYVLIGTLVDGSGAEIETVRAEASLPPGSQTLTLNFDGARIFAHGQNGPFRLTGVALSEEDPDTGASLPVLDADDVHTTSAYDVDQFERPGLLIRRVSSVAPVDTDGNGKFDLVEVGLVVNGIVAGEHEFSGRLVGSNGDEASFAAAAKVIPAAEDDTVTLQFPGCNVGQSNSAGPYSVESVLGFGPSGSAVAIDSLATANLKLIDFECATLGQGGVAAPVMGRGVQVAMVLILMFVGIYAVWNDSVARRGDDPRNSRGK